MATGVQTQEKRFKYWTKGPMTGKVKETLQLTGKFDVSTSNVKRRIRRRRTRRDKKGRRDDYGPFKA